MHVYVCINKKKIQISKPLGHLIFESVSGMNFLAFRAGAHACPRKQRAERERESREREREQSGAEQSHGLQKGNSNNEGVLVTRVMAMYAIAALNKRI